MPEDFSLRAVSPPLPPVERFAQYLQAQGKRVTQQRRLIVEEVYSHHDHFDADELMEHLQDLIAQRQVSRPTVYRTLAELVDARLLRKMSLGGRSVFEHDYGYPSHDHLHCEVCNKLIEFHSEEMERLRDAVATKYSFQVRNHRMFVNGICRDCQRREGSDK